MTVRAIEALRADHGALVAAAERFTDDDWATPSGCDGWAVRDVVAHMAQLFRQMVDPGSLPPPDPAGTEATQERFVDAVRDVAPERILADYRELTAAALPILERLQGRDEPLDLGDLGTHPRHLLANAYSFDHFTHIRADVFGPWGPLPQPAPPADEVRVGAALDWMLPGARQMNRVALDGLEAAVSLVLTGPAATSAVYGPEGGPAATVTSSSTDFVLWGTKRRSWRDLAVTITGDAELGARFCDAVHVF
jgi:uncharacterized protein (TIGR03083 family)